MLKGVKKGQSKGSFRLLSSAREVFEELKLKFKEEPMLRHFNPSRKIRVETDVSGFACGAVLSQSWKNERGEEVWYPVAFWFKKLDETQQHYGTPDQEMLVIVKAFEHWRHYLEDAQHPIQVLTDHTNLRGFMKHTRKVSHRRQVFWLEQLAVYDFEILYRTGKTNPADGSSRRPDYVLGEDTGLLTHFKKLAFEEEAKLSGEVSEILDVLHNSRVLTVNVKKVGEAQCWESLDAGIPCEQTCAVNHDPMDLDASGSSQDPKRERLNDGADIDYPVHHVSRLLAINTASDETADNPPTPRLVQLISKLQRRDAFASELRQELDGDAGKESSRTSITRNGGTWTMVNDLLMRGTSVYIPADAAVRHELLKIHHDDPWSGHFGFKKTMAALRAKYYWPNMKSNVKDYVDTCQICQKAKAPRHKSHGRLQVLQEVKNPWSSITMDFITGLPSSFSTRGKKRDQDAILVVVDRYTKMARYLPCSKKLDAEDLAELLVREIFEKHGVPENIVSDRGVLFTSKYWSTFCFYLRVTRKLSTAFHSQTDGQTEIQNQILERYLRNYVNHKQTDWVDWLPSAELAYNAAEHSSTGMAPFMADRGYIPRSLAEAQLPELRWVKSVPAKERVELLKEVREELETRLQEVRKEQARHYDKKHMPKEFNVGDKVLLSTKHLRTSRPSRKLDFKLVGPFTVLEPVGKVVYRLQLPPQYRIHPVFHVSILESYRARPGEEPPEPSPVLVDDVEEYEIEKIVDHRRYRGKRQFHVIWKGYSIHDGTWEKEENLKSAREALQDYWNTLE